MCLTRILCLTLTGVLSTFSKLVIEPQNTTVVVSNQTRFVCQPENADDFFQWKEYVTVSVGNVIFYNPPGGQPENPHYQIEDTYNLLIKDTVLWDGGQYGCNTFDMESDALSNLVVLDLPILLIPNLIENQTTLVSCSAHYGSVTPDRLNPVQRPQLSVYLDGDALDLNVTLIPGHPPQDGISFQASTLQTHFNYTPKISDEGRELRCEIRTNTPPVRASITSTIQVRFSVRNITIYPRRAAYKVGEQINCTAEGNPVPDISWTPIRCPYPYIPTGQTVVMLDSMVGENVWKCSAKNSADVTETVETEIEFIIEAQNSNGLSLPRQHLGLVLLIALTSTKMTGQL